MGKKKNPTFMTIPALQKKEQAVLFVLINSILNSLLAFTMRLRYDIISSKKGRIQLLSIIIGDGHRQLTFKSPLRSAIE